MIKLKQVQNRVRILNTDIGTPHNPRLNADARERKRFYDSAMWRQTRAAKIRRDPYCQSCAVEGIVTQADEVDHRTSIAAGGHKTADENLVSLCTPCHSRKTLAERNGTTLPPIVTSKSRNIVLA